MNITIEIPDEINQQLVGIKNINAFIIDALKRALETQTPVNTNEPLLSLSGILTYEKNDISENHDDYIGESIKND
jgi:hypothetical protein